MPGLVFSEEHLINGNIFKFEERLNSHMSKYNDGGELLTTYFSQDENSSTVDRGLQDIDHLFGKQAPLRFIRILNFPLNSFTPTTPENTEEHQLEDIGVEGDAIIFPSTIVPKQFDCFIINHLKMTALFQVTAVQYDTMKVEGFYKIHYRLHSTSKEIIDKLMTQVTSTKYTDLNAIGSNRNPIIDEKNFVLRSKIEKILDQMIDSYRAMFYNRRHNCFLFHDSQTGMDYFDYCENEFMARHSLMNIPNCTDVIVLHDKLKTDRFPYEYNNSVYKWIENECPSRFTQKFHYKYIDAGSYQKSSFFMWDDTDIQVMVPLSLQELGKNNRTLSIFDDSQIDYFLNTEDGSCSSDFDLLIWRFIHKQGSLSLDDIPLYIGDGLMSSINHRDIYLYTPIAIYIIRMILSLN